MTRNFYLIVSLIPALVAAIQISVSTWNPLMAAFLAQLILSTVATGALIDRVRAMHAEAQAQRDIVLAWMRVNGVEIEPKKT